MARVLLTGGTGFLGGAVASLLLRDSRVEQLLCLVRGPSSEVARARLLASVQRFGDLGPQPGRLQVIAGDLLSLRLERAQADAVTHVVHAAASTSFRSVNEVLRTNLGGTLALAEQLRRSRSLVRFLHLGTAYQCGRVEGTEVTEETPPSPDHVVDYTRSKAAAESALRSLSGLPLLVARPSAVIGHTVLGVAPSTSLYWYYRSLAIAGIAPFPESRRRDVVPVDWVAAALVHLLFLRAPAHDCFHISAGAGAACSWGELRLSLGRSEPTLQVAADRLGSHPAWDRVAGADARFRRALDLVARFATVPVDWFSNARLLASGFAPPPRFAGYLPLCRTSERGSLRQLLDDEA